MTPQTSRPPHYATYQSGQLINPNAEALDTNFSEILSRKFWASIDTQHPYAAKPPKVNAGAISKALEACGFKPWELGSIAAHVSKGCTVLPADCGGTRNKDAWERQQLWFIDMDNGNDVSAHGYKPLGYTYAVERCFSMGLPLVLSYETFNSPGITAGGESVERYRLVFAKDAPERDSAKAESFGRALMAIFPECDRSTIQPNRMFYGTDKEVHVWM